MQPAAPSFRRWRGLLAALVASLAAPALAQPPAESPGVPPGWKWDAYHGYDEVSRFLEHLAGAYPDLAEKRSLGTSVQGRELWALRITDHPEREEDEPEVRFVGGIHGDEPAGIELSLRLAHRLLTGYGNEPRVARLVEQTEIWIVPLLNPDGREVRKRENARNADLNRHFPNGSRRSLGNLLYGPEPGLATIEPTAPEVAHLMRWSVSNRFVLGAFFHGGALVVVYPYSADKRNKEVYSPTADDPLFREVALSYSRANPSLAEVAKEGIINAAEWYLVLGSSMDWTYNYTGLLDFDLEISAELWPSEDALPTLWRENEESLFRFIAQAQRGVHGVVRDATSGAPISAALQVEGIHHFVFTDPAVGDFHRPLLPGTYRLIVSAPGYVTRTFEDVVVTAETPTRLDVALEPRSPAFSLKVNFGPRGAPIPTGFVADTGEAFAAHEGGVSYGWSEPVGREANGRNAMISKDPRFDTFVRLRRGGPVWEVTVPTGLYSVRVVAGDPEQVRGRFQLEAEGTRLLDGRPTKQQPWLEAAQLVRVIDGRLTLACGPDAPGTKLAYLEVSQVPEPAVADTASSGEASAETRR